MVRWITLLCVLASAAAPSVLLAAESKRPNIILIFCNDLGYGDIGPFGQQKIKTPHLDQMAREGTKFTSAYCGTSVCAPSRCALMLGQHMGHAPIRANREVKPEGQMPLPKGSVTIAQVLKDAGYSTACVGKWGLGFPGSGSEAHNMGFDYFYGYNCQRKAHNYYPPTLWRNGERVDIAAGTYAHDVLTEEALGWVKKHHAEPFFLYWAETIPHAPWNPPSAAPYENEDWPATEKNFAAMITRMDAGVGRMLALLKELKIDDNTLVIFTSDNGAASTSQDHDQEFFNSNGDLRGAKRGMYEGSLRVPTLARWPGVVAAGASSDAPWANWDLFPTFAELASAKVPASVSLDGHSIVPLLKGRDLPERDYFYWELHEGPMVQAARWGDWKAVRNGPREVVAIFDLKRDPQERQNLASTRADLVKRAEDIFADARRDSPDFPVRANNANKKKPNS